uniref:Uncharacterized protein n=1 Tax=Arundo donax TaxID=35708 RepID=A0A0A9B298_ARUDO
MRASLQHTWLTVISFLQGFSLLC